MASRFLLRGKDDTENPVAPRLYHVGTTQGRNVFYLSNSIGNRTAFIALLSEGARFPTDTGCRRAIKVMFAGFELPEFDASGGRNWKFHKGTIPAPPVYKPCTFQASTDKVLSTAHGLNNDDPVAFQGRKSVPAGVAPTFPAGIQHPHVKYFVVNKTVNDYQIAATLGGTPIPIDIDSVGAIFCYRANAGLFDAEQGTPHFFPSLKYNFAGLSYIELLLPADLSNGEDEPTKLKVMMDGKAVFDLQKNIGTGLLEITGSEITSKNNALIAYDVLKNDGKFASDRFHADSWLEWRDRCAGQIPWVGGETNVATPLSFPVLSNATYATGTLTATGAGAQAFTEAFAVRNSSIEATYNGGASDFVMIFTTAQTPSSQAHGIIIQPDGDIFFTNGVQVNLIGTAYPSDRLKVAYEAGQFKAYQNNVPLPLTDIALNPQPAGNFYCFIGLGASGMTATNIAISPSGTTTTPRTVDRFTGGVVLADKTSIADIFETEIFLSGGTSWQDVDGEVVILPTPDRPVVATFNADPNSEFPTNCKRITVKRRDARQAPNFYRWSFRDLDDPLFTRKFVNTDRQEIRDKVGYVDAGLREFGVMTQSQMERIGETTARLNTDLDIGWTVEAFLDTLQAAKGDFVHIIDPASGFTDAAPALAIVISELLSPNEEVESRRFECNIITRDFYSDTAHGRVVPLTHNHIGANFLPPPPLESLDLTESTRNLNGADIPIIEGEAVFAPTPNQTGRVFIRSFGALNAAVEFDHTTDTIADPDFAELAPWEGELVNIIEATGADTLPAGLDTERAYLFVNTVFVGYQFKDPDTMAVVPFTTNGSGDLRIVPARNWRDTNITVTPNPTTRIGLFSIDAVELGFHHVRVQTRSAGGVSQSFLVQRDATIEMLGDLNAPQPPSDLQAIFDGAHLRWQFNPSTSIGVAGYQVTDGEGRVIDSLQFITDLGFTETVRTLMTARRVYAVSRSGVRSINFAALTFYIPVQLSWMNVIGADVTDDGLFTKTAATGWGNSGGVLNHAVLSNMVPATLLYKVDRTDQFKIFGFSRSPVIDSHDDFYFAIYFHDNGQVFARWYDGGVQSLFIGNYFVGEEWFIQMLPPEDLAEVGDVWIKKIYQVGNRRVVYDQHNFQEIPHHFPMFAGAALYTQGSDIAPNFTIGGILVPTTSIAPSMQNFVNAAFVSGDLTNTAGGVGGASTVEKIAENQDGEFSFNVFEDSYVSVGLSNVDVDTNPLAPYFAVVFKPDDTAEVWVDGVFAFLIGVGSNPAIRYSFTRENGLLCFRADGHLKAYYDGAADLDTVALLLDVAFYAGAAAGDGLNDLRFRQAVETILEDGDRVPIVNAIEQARVGVNFVYDIPKFGAAMTPVEGDGLVWQNGAFVNAPIVASGAPFTGGGANRVIFQDGAQNLATSPKFLFDGTDVQLVNPTVATAGAPSVPSPKIYMIGARWRTDALVSSVSKIRFGLVPTTLTGATFTMDFWSPEWTAAWEASFSYGVHPTVFTQTRIKLGSPLSAAWGGILDISHVGEFIFSDAAGTRAQLAAVSLGKGSELGYEQFWVNNYSPEIRSHFGERILFAAGRPFWKYADNVGNTGTEYIHSENLKMVFVNPTLATVGTQNQLPPVVQFDGHAWDTTAAVSKTIGGRIGVGVGRYDGTGQGSPRFLFQTHYQGGSWVDVLWYGVRMDAGFGLDMQMAFRHPAGTGWGGHINCSYNGNFSFTKDDNTAANLYIGAIGLGAAGLPNITFPAFYGAPQFHGYFGEAMRFKAAGAGLGVTFVESEVDFYIGTTANPAKLWLLSTTEQFRVQFSASQHFNLTVSSVGAAVFSASGSSPKLHMAVPTQFFTGSGGSSWIPFTDARIYLSAVETVFRNNVDLEFLRFNPSLITFQNGLHIEFGTAGGTKFGTSPSQKMAWWGNTPVARIAYGDVDGYTIRRSFDPNVDTISDLMDFVCTVYFDLATSYGLFTPA